MRQARNSRAKNYVSINISSPGGEKSHQGVVPFLLFLLRERNPSNTTTTTTMGNEVCSFGTRSPKPARSVAWVTNLPATDWIFPHHSPARCNILALSSGNRLQRPGPAAQDSSVVELQRHNAIFQQKAKHRRLGWLLQLKRTTSEKRIKQAIFFPPRPYRPVHRSFCFCINKSKLF